MESDIVLLMVVVRATPEDGKTCKLVEMAVMVCCSFILPVQSP